MEAVTTTIVMTIEIVTKVDTTVMTTETRGVIIETTDVGDTRVEEVVITIIEDTIKTACGSLP